MMIQSGHWALSRMAKPEVEVTQRVSKRPFHRASPQLWQRTWSMPPRPAAAQAGLELDHRGVGDLGHFGHDLLVHRRGHLAAVGPAHLVAVVFLGVVRGGDHHAGHGALQPHRVAHLGRRTDVVEDIDVDAVGREDVRRDAGEFLALVAGVVGDADLGVVPFVMREDIVGQSLRGHAYRIAVHPVGTDAHDAAQATGAELEVLVKSIFESGGVIVAELDDLELGLLVEIAVKPLLGPEFKFFHAWLCLMLSLAFNSFKYKKKSEKVLLLP